MICGVGLSGLAVSREKRGHSTPQLRIYYRISRWQIAVDDSHTRRRRENEQGVCHLGIGLPVREVKLDSHTPRVSDKHTNQLAGHLDDFEEDRFSTPSALRRSLRRTSIWRCSAGAAGCARKHDIIGGFRLFVEGRPYPGAYPGYFHFPSKQSERRTPICTLLGRNPRHSVIGGDKEPGRLAINQEKVFFGDSYSPPHLTRGPQKGRR